MSKIEIVEKSLIIEADDSNFIAFNKIIRKNNGRKKLL